MADASVAENQAPPGPLSVADATKLLLADRAPQVDQAPVEAAPRPEAPAPAPETREAPSDDVSPTDAIADLLGLSEDSSNEVSDQEPDDAPRYTVKAAGEDIEVTLEELQRGYQRQADYTNKTKELSEQRKAAEEARVAAAQLEQNLTADREQLQNRLTQLNDSLAQTVAQEPSQDYWDQLYQTDESEWARQKILWQETKSRQQDLAAEARSEQERLNGQYHQQLSVRRSQEEAKMLEKIPAWKNAKTRTSEMGGIIEHLRGKGFADQEILSEMDSRVVDMARDAWLLSQIRGQISKARSRSDQGPRPLGRTRSSPRASVTKETTRLHDSLKQSGSVADAVALLKARSK